MFKIGLLKEIKSFEGRVMLTPEGVKVLVKNGLEVFVEQGVGEACAFDDIQYERAGATVLPTMEKVMQRAQILLQVRPPQPIEFELLNDSHIFICFLNLIHNPDRLQALLETRATFISAELIQDDKGKYPLLMGMSEVTGHMVIHKAAELLTTAAGGKGRLLADIKLARPVNITIVGAGKVGRTAARTARANGAHVHLLSLKAKKLEMLNKELPDVKSDLFSYEKLRDLLPHTDVLIVAVYSMKREYNIRITRDMVAMMEEGSVLIDISVEQAEVVETSHVTSHDQPTYQMEGVLHYCVPNIAAIVPITASRIITKKILPFVKTLGLNGLKKAIVDESGLIPAISMYKGKMTNRNFSEYYGQEFYSIFELLELNL